MQMIWNCTKVFSTETTWSIFALCLKHRRLQRRLCRPKCPNQRWKRWKLPRQRPSRRNYIFLWPSGEKEKSKKNQRDSQTLAMEYLPCFTVFDSMSSEFCMQKISQTWRDFRPDQEKELQLIRDSIQQAVRAHQYGKVREDTKWLQTFLVTGKASCHCNPFWSFRCPRICPPNWPIDLYIVDIVDIVVTLSWLCDFDFKSF